MSKFDSLNDTFNTDDGIEVDAIVKTENTELQKSQTRAENVEKDYNEDNVIDTQDDLLIEPGDDFGFTETSSFFGDAKEFSPTRKVDI